MQEKEVSEEEVIEQAEQEEPEEAEQEESSGEEEVEGEAEQEVEPKAEKEEDEIVVSIGEESPPEDERTLSIGFRELRKANREKARRIKELEAKLAAPDVQKPSQLGQKPTLEGHDYDADKYESALATWFERKRQIDAETEKAKEAEQAQQKAWQERLDAYSQKKAKIKVSDYEDLEETVQGALNTTQQGILIDAMDNPELIVVALGRNPKELERLAAIKSPTKFLRELSRIEDTKLKVTNKRTAPPPEKAIKGTAPVSGSVDSTLNQLRAEAAKSGDYTKVNAYKRQKRNK